MKFTNAFCVAFATTFTVASAAPIIIAARQPLYVARSFEDINAREPFDWGSIFKAVAPIAKPWVAKIPKVGGFLSSFFRRDDGSLDEELLENFLANVAARSPDDLSVVARDLDERDPFDWGGIFKAVAPIAKPWIAKIPKVGGFLSSFFKRDDGSLDEELLDNFLAKVIARNYGDMELAARDLDSREPFDWGSIFKAVAPIAKPWVAKIPKVGGFLSSFFKRDDGTLDEDLLNDFLAAQALSTPRIAARSPQELADGLVATAILSQLAKDAGSISARDLEGREPFDWGSIFKAVAPIAKPWVAKIPKVGGFLSSFFKRDGTLDDELVADFLKVALSRRDESDAAAEAVWNDIVNALGA